MIEPGALAAQARLDLAQTQGAGQLPEQEGQELPLAGQAPGPIVGPMPVDQTVEHAPGNMLQNLMKNAIVMPHDIDPLFVSQTPRNV